MDSLFWVVKEWVHEEADWQSEIKWTASHLLGRCIWNTSCQTVNKPFCMSFCPMLLLWMSTRRTSFFCDLKKWSTERQERMSLWDLSARATSVPISVFKCCLRAISSSRCANLCIWRYNEHSNGGWFLNNCRCYGSFHTFFM